MIGRAVTVKVDDDFLAVVAALKVNAIVFLMCLFGDFGQRVTQVYFVLTLLRVLLSLFGE